MLRSKGLTLHIALLLLTILTASLAHAQEIVVSDVDVSDFPTIRARFRALDRDLKPLAGLTPADFAVTEDGVVRPVLELTDCRESRIVPLTVGIMVDTKYHIDLARAGTKRLANLLQMPPSELGITTMNGGVYIVQDLTKKREKVIDKGSALQPAPGVDLQRMFYDTLAGGVPFVSGRPNRKVLVLISDLHCPMLNLDTARLFADAARENITVYSVLLHANDYTGLFRKIAARTGGGLFENVADTNQIDDIFALIGMEQYGVPCVLAWQSAPQCRIGRSASIALPAHGASAALNFATPPHVMPHLEMIPMGISFGRVTGGPKDQDVTITARNADIPVNAITSDNGRFTVIDYGGAPPPFILPRDASRTLKVRFTPIDSSYNFATLEAVTDLCPGRALMSGGFPGVGGASTLKLTHPNGGEEFMVGIDTVITWEGILPQDKVRLEYSIDAGAHWMTVAEGASGLRHGWSVPNTPSRSCLARATQLTSGTDSVLRFNSFAVTMRWSPAGTGLAVAGASDTALRIFDAARGYSIASFTTPTLNGYAVLDWNPDGNRVAIGGNQGAVYVWDQVTGTVSDTLIHYESDPDHDKHGIIDLRWSHDGGRLATLAEDSYLRIWDGATGARISKSDLGDAGLRVAWSGADDRVAILGLNSLMVWDVTADTLVTKVAPLRNLGYPVVAWNAASDRVAAILGFQGDSLCVMDAKSGAIIARDPDNTGMVTDFAWSPDGALIASGTDDGMLTVWRAESGQMLYKKDLGGVTDGSARPMRVAWSPDGMHLAADWRTSWTSDGTIFVLDPLTGDIINQLSHQGDAGTLAWSPDGSRLAAAFAHTLYAQAAIWNLFGEKIQQDVSDALWAIIAPQPEVVVKDIHMGLVQLGKGRDSLVAGVLCNRGTAPLHVLGMDLTGGDAADFMIPSGAGDFTLAPGECRAITVEFMPTKLGARRATVTVRMVGDTLADTITLRGVGVEPVLLVEAADIDFGTVRVLEAKDTSVAVVLRNVGSVPLTVIGTPQGGPDSTQFAITGGAAPFTLPPGGTHTMQLRFTPTSVGRSTGRIMFEYGGTGSPAAARLIGRGLGGIVYVPDDSAAAGERFMLRLMIDPQGPRTAKKDAQRFRAQLRVNQTLLASADAASPGALDSGRRTLTIDGAWDGLSDTLMRIPMVALLGDSDRSTLELVGFDWLDMSARPLGIETETRSGTFHLIGICSEGGDRLYDERGVAAALKAAPNPASSALELEYDLAEDGAISIELYDLAGTRIRSILDGERPRGAYRLRLSTAQLPSGSYLLTLRTPTQVVTERVEVRR